MKHTNVTIWEHGDRVVTPRGPGEVIRPPVNPWASTPPVGVRLDDGSDWRFFAQELQPESGAEANNALHCCQHVGPTLSMPGEPVQCGPCIYCGTPHEEWETLV
jgi:hypothetical protein